MEKQTKNNLNKEKLNALLQILGDCWLMPDKNVVKVMLAGVVSHHFEADPLWIFLIAPPASLKTELIASLDRIEEVYQISSLTPQTLFSGLRKIRGQPDSNSILEKIGDKILTLKDFTTVLSMRWEDRAIVLAQLREVYDGRYRARYGNGVEVNWEGRIGLIAGVTPAIDTHYSVFQVLGERFIQYRLTPVSEEKLTEKSISAIGSEKETRVKAQKAVVLFIESLKIPSVKEVEIPEEIKKSLGKLASFVVRARSGTVRDSYRKTLEYIPEPEAPPRLAKQLATLCCALAVLEGRKKVDVKDYLLALKVGFDCVPRQRMMVLNFLAGGERQFSTTEIAEGINYSREGAIIHCEDLVAHSLVEVKREGSGQPNLWQLSSRTKGYFEGFLTEELIEILKASDFKKDGCCGNILDLLLKTPPIRVKRENNSSSIGSSFSSGLEKSLITGSNRESPDSFPEDIFEQAKEIFK